MVNLWVWEKFLAPILVTLSPSYQSAVGQILPRSQDSVRTADSIAGKLNGYIPLVMISTWLNFGTILLEIFFSEFSRKIWNAFFPNQTFYLPDLRNGWSNWCETKRKRIDRMLRWLGYLYIWPWIFKGKLYIGTGRPNCHGTKRTRVDGIPWCETQRKWVN